MANYRIVTTALMAALVSLGMACKDDDRPSKGDPGSGATETNVAPAPCSGDDDCPPGIACKTLDAGADAGGFCDVNEMNVEPGSGSTPVSSAAPAPCSANNPCPAGIKCVYPNGGTVGFCDVVEMVAH